MIFFLIIIIIYKKIIKSFLSLIIIFEPTFKYQHPMQKQPQYYDLSLLTQKTIDPTYFLKKIQSNNFTSIAIDTQILDPKPNPSHNKTQNKADSIKIQGLKIYKRITLIIQNTISLHPLGQQQNAYQCDILAIKPLNQKIFHSVCTEYDNYDIITFDICNKLPFMLKRNPVYQAIRKGKYFQISYEGMFDENKRVIAMTNIINIIKATNGKNLITSSHVSDASMHRTPYDIAALLMSLGIDKNKALATMKENCIEVIRSGQHRLYLKGAIQEIPVSIGIKLNKRIQKHRDNIKRIQQKLGESKLKEQQKQKQKQSKMKQQNK